MTSENKYTSRLRTKYQKEVIPRLQKEFSYKNVNQVPVLECVTVNMGLGEATQNPKLIDTALLELASITGQKPIVTRSKKAIANFKVRKDQPIGIKVTLRQDHMYDFVDRLFSLALPRTRDFKGVNPKSFDGRGNFTLGIREQIIFPEIEYDKVEKVKGMNVTFVTSAKTDAEGRALLTALGMPFRS